MLFSCSNTSVVAVRLSYHIYHFSNVRDQSNHSSALQHLILDIAHKAHQVWTDQLKMGYYATNRCYKQQSCPMQSWLAGSCTSAFTDFMTSFSAGTPSQYQLIKKVKLWSTFNCSLKTRNALTFFHCCHCCLHGTMRKSIFTDKIHRVWGFNHNHSKYFSGTNPLCAVYSQV